MCICKLPRYLLYSLPIFLIGWAWVYFSDAQNASEICKPIIERHNNYSTLRGCTLPSRAELTMAIAPEHKDYLANLLWVNQLLDAQDLPYQQIPPHLGYKVEDDFEKSVLIGKYLAYLLYAQLNKEATDSYLYAESIDILAQDLDIETPIDQVTFRMLVAQQPKASLTLNYVYTRLMALSHSLSPDKKFIFDGILWGSWLAYMDLQIEAFSLHQDTNLAKSILQEAPNFSALYEKVFPYLNHENPSRFSDIQKLNQWQQQPSNQQVLMQSIPVFAKHIDELQ